MWKASNDANVRFIDVNTFQDTFNRFYHTLSVCRFSRYLRVSFVPSRKLSWRLMNPAKPNTMRQTLTPVSTDFALKSSKGTAITFHPQFPGSYQYGYEVGPNGQFHHETRGPDGVTYGCYGYIDPNGQLRVTHYVADTHGYRVVEPNRPVEIFVDAPTQYSK